MSDDQTHQSQCLCGQVKLTISLDQPHVEACHCGICQRWGGGPLLGMQCSQIDINSEESVAVFNSSAWAHRAFCKNCGTHLFYKLNDAPIYFVPAGLFPEIANRHFVEEIFIDEKPDYYDFANDTEKLTGEEAIAKYTSD